MPFKPKGLDVLNKEMLADISKELRLQGHHDTGALEQSLKPYLQAVNNEVIMQAYALGYIEDLEEGVPAEKINVSDADFEKLKGWVKRKIGGQLRPADVTATAAAIVRKWKKEGKPLSSSRAYSQTGEVTGAIKTALEENEQKYERMMDDAIFNEFDAEFSKTKSSTI